MFCCHCLQHVPNLIVDIKCRGDRVIVSDVQESVFFVRYKRQENQLIIYMDDCNQRCITTSILLDFDTIACADKFGNICVVSTLRFCCWGLTKSLCLCFCITYFCFGGVLKVPSNHFKFLCPFPRKPISLSLIHIFVCCRTSISRHN